MFPELCGKEAEIAKKKLVVGFDGFVDTIARPLRSAASGHTAAQPFLTIREFGEFLVGKAEKSCSIELQTEARQLGGNLPYLSRAAGNLGLDVTCIGMLGENGRVEDCFAQMPCTLYPFAPSGQSMCLEFQDGKVLLAPTCTLPREPWEMVQEATTGQAVSLFGTADLIALVNWSELAFAHSLWTSVWEKGIALENCDKKRFAFFDLCDCSRKTSTELGEVLQLIGQFSTRRTTVLSLNENEARDIGRRFPQSLRKLTEIAMMLRKRYRIDEILIHTIHESILCNTQGAAICPTEFVNHPVISTGAGDHFNAASCFALVMGLENVQRIAFANRFANFYITHGKSPSLQEIL